MAWWPTPKPMVEIRSTSSPSLPGSSWVRPKRLSRMPLRRGLSVDGLQRGVDSHTDVGLLGLGADGFPAGLRRHPEGVDHRVVVPLLQRLGVVGGVRQVELAGLVGEGGLQFIAALVERIADVFQENQPEDDVLVLGGIHARAQLVCGGPECLFKVLVQLGFFLSCFGYSSQAYRTRRCAGYLTPWT